MVPSVVVRVRVPGVLVADVSDVCAVHEFAVGLVQRAQPIGRREMGPGEDFLRAVPPRRRARS